MSQMKLEDLINTQYLETDTPELLIQENNNVKDIVSYILKQLEEKDILKKKFNKKDFIKEIGEDYDFVSHLEVISEDLLVHIRDSYGSLVMVDDRTNCNMNGIWKFTREEVNNLDKENRKYYCRF